MVEVYEVGIVYCDVKFDNVFIMDVWGEMDFVKVFDFGIVKVVVGDVGIMEIFMWIGMLVGMFVYMFFE